MKKILLLSLTLFIALPFYAQETDSTATEPKDTFDISTLPPHFQKLYTIENSVMELSYMLLRDSLEKYRTLASTRLSETFKEALSIKGSFDYPFERSKHISFQYPEDSAFRIITWQLYVDKNEYQYFGILQTNEENSRVITLQDQSNDMYGNLEQKTLSPSDWYGALYYNIKKVAAKEGDYYLLFGYDALEFFGRRKIVDVLTLEKDKVVFGAPVFVKEREEGFLPETFYRLVIDYSAEAAIKVNFSEEYDLLLYDHLIPWGGSYKQGETYVPDGSYEGYKLKDDGRWYHIAKVFNDFQEEAPRSQPVLDTRGRGLFGPSTPKKHTKKRVKKVKN